MSSSVALRLAASHVNLMIAENPDGRRTFLGRHRDARVPKRV
jgi:hypothetical protein